MNESALNISHIVNWTDRVFGKVVNADECVSWCHNQCSIDSNSGLSIAILLILMSLIAASNKQWHFVIIFNGLAILWLVFMI